MAGIQKEKVHVRLHYSSHRHGKLKRCSVLKRMREGVHVCDAPSEKKALKPLFYLEACEGDEKTAR